MCRYARFACLGERKAEGPTIAALEYALPGRVESKKPLLPAAKEFDFWVIDEIDMRRLLDYTSVRNEEVKRVVETHPDESVRVLVGALNTLMTGVVFPC